MATTASGPTGASPQTAVRFFYEASGQAMSKPVSGGKLRSSVHPGRPVGGRDPGGASKQEPREAHARSPGHGPAEKQRTARGAGVPGVVSRSPKTRESLGRLRRELARISPPPGNPEEVVAEIAMALARANLSDWAAPLHAAENRETGPDGDSLKIRLAAHEIAIQSNGAFCIVDRHPPMAVYFSMPGRGKPPRGGGGPTR
jgi:hypothetical protein